LVIVLASANHFTIFSAINPSVSTRCLHCRLLSSVKFSTSKLDQAIDLKGNQGAFHKEYRYNHESNLWHHGKILGMPFAAHWGDFGRRIATSRQPEPNEPDHQSKEDNRFRITSDICVYSSSSIIQIQQSASGPKCTGFDSPICGSVSGSFSGACSWNHRLTRSSNHVIDENSDRSSHQSATNDSQNHRCNCDYQNGTGLFQQD
jgi:hypothetical protein